jgi:hypothetical protein
MRSSETLEGFSCAALDSLLSLKVQEFAAFDSDIPVNFPGIEADERNLQMPEGPFMSEKETTERAKKDLREGKSSSTAAGEFVREEIDHMRKGKHGARSPQAIAIRLSKACRAGIPLKAPARGKASEETRHKAEKDLEKGQTSPKTDEEGGTARGRSRMETMKQEPKNTTSHAALSQHAKSAAQKRRSKE